MKRLLLFGAFCTLVCVCFAPAPVYGQASATGTVSGLVTDQTGAVIVGAQVTLTDTASKSSKTEATNDAGRFVFVNVFPGIYDIKVAMKGFRQLVVAAQEVVVGETLTVNAALEVGTTSEVVEVRAVSGAELQTTNATIGTTMSGESLLTFPNLNRDATSLLTFQPNTAPAVGGGDIYGGQVAGSLSDQNTYMLDGGNITSDLEGDNNYTNNGVGGMGAIPTPLESIQEFKVATSNQTADFSVSAGGEVLLVSKRGADAFHGAAYEYYQSQLFNANGWNNNFYAEPIVKFHDNRYGGGFGGPLLPGKHLGGKTYFYGFYEGHKYPGTASELTWSVPSALMRQGILQYADASGVVHQVNLATSTACNVTTTNPTGACDPRGIGISPLVEAFWNKYEPMPNFTGSSGDYLNIQEYRAPLVLPESDNYAMVRLDHDFGDKWRLFTSYRYFHETNPTADQVDIGGLLPGDKLGVPASASSDPRAPGYFVAGLTGTLTNSLINEFHISYLLNDWAWIRQGVTFADSSVPAGIEFADSQYGCLCPLNMNTQQSRDRIWDGHDWNYNDTLSWNRGNHFMQFGGTITHWWDHHVRDDQVVAGLPEMVYQLNKGPGLITSDDNRPAGMPSSNNGTWDGDYASVLGIVGTEAQMFIRQGDNFNLTNLKNLSDTSLIDSYSLYYNDSWKIRPSLTLNYGLEWGTQMPPYEINGVQDIAVDANGIPMTGEAFLQNTVNDALQGQVYNPVIGFMPIHDVAGHPKYPFNPYYGAFSPRVALAWNPKFDEGFLDRVFGHGKTVIRLGFSRLYDRNNGVDLVLTPLLGYGFGQTIRCTGAGIIDDAADCYGPTSTTPANAFRLGVDGTTGPFPAVQQTLPVPAEPGINTPAGSNISFLDNNWRPGVNNGVTFGIQRELPDNIIVEAAYVGKWTNHIYQGLDLNDVPWMMTLGGQSFAQAYANLWKANNAGATTVAPQPFFELALKGSPYCAAYTSCTAAVYANEGSSGTGNIGTESVYALFSDLDTGAFCQPACPFTAWGGHPLLPADLQGYNSMTADTTMGFSNYQAGILTVQKRTGHGLMMNANLTWSHTLDTMGINQEYTEDNVSVPFNLHQVWGPAPFDHRLVFNLLATYQLPFGKGQRFATNNGIMDRIIGGWMLSPIFTASSGLPMETYTGSCDEYGQGNVPQCSGLVPTLPVDSYSTSAHFNVSSPYVGSAGNVVACAGAAPGVIPNCGGSGVNLFANPTAVYNTLQPIVLGLNSGRSNDMGPLYGQSRWNLDLSITKETHINERMGLTFYAQMFNVCNHMEFNDPGQYGSAGIDLQNAPGFGVMFGQYNSPRHMELGLRFYF